MFLFQFGTIFQVALLLINAIAILNEERFLARSASRSVGILGNSLTTFPLSRLGITIARCKGWKPGIPTNL